MKNRENPGGAGIGPGKDWAAWRERRNKAIAKPRKNAGAMRLHKMKESEAVKPDADVSESKRT